MALVGRESVDAPGRASAEDTHVGDATLLGLPVELQKMILEYCSTNADKKNVCATSKRLHAVMTPLPVLSHGARFRTAHQKILAHP